MYPRGREEDLERVDAFVEEAGHNCHWEPFEKTESLNCHSCTTTQIIRRKLPTVMKQIGGCISVNN